MSDSGHAFCLLQLHLLFFNFYPFQIRILAIYLSSVYLFISPDQNIINGILFQTSDFYSSLFHTPLLHSCYGYCVSICIFKLLLYFFQLLFTARPYGYLVAINIIQLIDKKLQRFFLLVFEGFDACLCNLRLFIIILCFGISIKINLIYF